MHHVELTSGQTAAKLLPNEELEKDLRQRAESRDHRPALAFASAQRVGNAIGNACHRLGIDGRELDTLTPAEALDGGPIAHLRDHVSVSEPRDGERAPPT